MEPNRGEKLRWRGPGALCAAVCVAALAVTATPAPAATQLTIGPATQPTIPSNGFPFGVGVTWPQLGLIYRNIPAFELRNGDNLAFDLAATNDVDIQLTIQGVQANFNGGTDPGGTYQGLVSAAKPVNPRGNSVIADYELRFTVDANTPFTFPGGGLILRIPAPAGAFAADGSFTTVLPGVPSTDASGFFLGRFVGDPDGLPPYTVSPNELAAFQLTFNRTCGGQPATVLGTIGANTVTGTNGPDVIAAYESNDVVNGGKGKDLICGGDGKDTLRGGPGKDRLLGEAGKDKLRGGKGNDKLIGGPGKDDQVQ